MTEEQQSTMLGVANNLGGKLIGNLPAQFLVLVGMNIIFVLGLIWFLEHQSTARERVITPILTACMQQIPVEVLKQVVELSHERK